MDNYFQKYVKYKNKYNQLKGGSFSLRKNFFLLKYETSNSNYKTGIITKPEYGTKLPGYTFNDLMYDGTTSVIIDNGLNKQIVEYSIKKYDLKCYNSDKDINIKVNLDLISDTFIIKIKKVDALIDVELKGTYICDKELLQKFQLVIQTSDIIINGYKYPFIIENKKYNFRELLNERIVTIDNANEKKLD